MKLKIVCLNMWSGGKLFPQLIEFLDAENADVVMLQEVYNGVDPGLPDKYRSMEVLSERLNYAYSAFALAYIEDSTVGKVPHGNAVLSNYPLLQKDNRFLQKSVQEYYQDIPEHWPILPSVLQHVEIKAPNGSAEVFNMHGVWDLDGDNPSPERMEMSRIILEETEALQRVILAGDTNAKPSNPAMKALEKRLRLVFDPPPITTFNMRRKHNPGYATAAVDLMYASPDVQIVEASCRDVEVSDHLPLVVTLEID
jgi:endonuclease/exonuclease/phosphatase family metal-dependent hydrolase